MTESKQLDEKTIQKLQEIRRANEAIKACAEILNEHGANDGSIPAGPRVFISQCRPGHGADFCH